ncbi:hypothetical protein Q3P09_22600, partial [Ralstonia pseudosolanacearum]|nr:hypothetical protein [Ralstonia pseudosolanacearum]
MTSSTTSVYLHALGMINALGDDLDTIVRGLATGNSPGMRAIDRPGVGPAMVGQVQTPLECAPPASLARYDCRNNRLLLGALAQIGHALRTACERYGHHRVGVVLGTSTSGVQEAEAALQYKRTHQTLPQAFDYLQMEIGTLAPFAAAALVSRSVNTWHMYCVGVWYRLDRRYR